MKGLMYEWILGMVGLFVVGVLFIAMSEAYDPLHDYGDTHIRINASDPIDVLARTNFTIIDTIWTYMPALMIFLFLLFILIQSQRRTPSFE